MKACIDEILTLYGKGVENCITPVKPNLFELRNAGDKCKNSALFHTMVAKLLCLGKWGRPDILLLLQFLCTPVQDPMEEDVQKLERMLGYLQMTKGWNKVYESATGVCARMYWNRWGQDRICKHSSHVSGCSLQATRRNHFSFLSMTYTWTLVQRRNCSLEQQCARLETMDSFAASVTKKLDCLSCSNHCVTKKHIADNITGMQKKHQKKHYV